MALIKGKLNEYKPSNAKIQEILKDNLSLMDLDVK